MNLENILEELKQQREIINKAYWSFTRCSKAKPPFLAVPEAYKRVAELEKLSQFAFKADQLKA